MSLIHHSNLKNEKALVKGCVEGDRVFQNQLYNMYAARMMGLCLRYAGSREDAEDILQEGFVQVFTCIRQFKFTGTLEAWIKKIFINCALQKLRGKENNYLFVDIEYAPEIQATTYSVIEEIDVKLLMKCIQNLPLISRIVFNLYAFEGFKHREIARMLSITEGTSKSNLFDARSKLKKQLKEYDLCSIKNTANEKKFT